VNKELYRYQLVSFVTRFTVSIMYHIQKQYLSQWLLDMSDLNKIKDDLESLLRKAWDLVKEWFEDTEKDVKAKRDANDVLTKYDLAANDLIVNYLEANYPDFSIISEEAPAIQKESEFAFIIDPIDGTRNFVRWIPVFYSGIWLTKNNKVILCITYNAISDEMFWAIKGQWAYKNNTKITVSDRTLPVSDIIVRVRWNKNQEKRVVSNIIEDVYQVKNNMCCHDEISWIACKRYDWFIVEWSSSWDYCQYLLVEEAWWKVTDREWNELDIFKGRAIMSNGVIHDKLIKAAGTHSNK